MAEALLQRPWQTPESAEARFREYLASRPKPLRFTEAQRRMIHFIFSRHNHFDAEQLCSELDRANLDISRATVYRTLNKLVNAGLLRRVQLGNRVAYEHDYGYPQHEHLVCDTCGKVIEFEAPQLESLYEAVCRQHGFQPSRHSLVVRGLCADCVRSRSTKRRLDLI